MVGRALRVSSSQSVATIIDVTDNWKKHGLPDDPRQWSLSATSVPYPNRGLIQCEKCTHIFRPLASEWRTTALSTQQKRSRQMKHICRRREI